LTEINILWKTVTQFTAALSLEIPTNVENHITSLYSKLKNKTTQNRPPVSRLHQTQTLPDPTTSSPAFLSTRVATVRQFLFLFFYMARTAQTYSQVWRIFAAVWVYT